jgi:hypothetical protein
LRSNADPTGPPIGCFLSIAVNDAALSPLSGIAVVREVLTPALAPFFGKGTLGALSSLWVGHGCLL